MHDKATLNFFTYCGLFAWWIRKIWVNFAEKSKPWRAMMSVMNLTATFLCEKMKNYILHSQNPRQKLKIQFLPHFSILTSFSSCSILFWTHVHLFLLAFLLSFWFLTIFFLFFLSSQIKFTSVLLESLIRNYNPKSQFTLFWQMTVVDTSALYISHGFVLIFFFMQKTFRVKIDKN